MNTTPSLNEVIKGAEDVAKQMRDKKKSANETGSDEQHFHDMVDQASRLRNTGVSLNSGSVKKIRNP